MENKNVCKNCGSPIGDGVTKCSQCGQVTALGGIQALGCLLTIAGVFIIGIVIVIVMFVGC